MPYELFLALRHLRSRHKRRLAHVTALIAVTGIAVGVAALMVALSLANGFRDELRDKILRGTAHLTIMRTDGEPMKNYEDVAARVAKVRGVTSASGTTYDGAIIVGKEASAYAVLRGIDVRQSAPREIEQPLVERASPIRTDLSSTLIAGSIDELFAIHGEPPDFAPVVLGIELAARTGLKVGDLAKVIGTRSVVSTQEDHQRNVYVAGIVRSDYTNTTQPGFTCRSIAPPLFPVALTQRLWSPFR